MPVSKTPIFTPLPWNPAAHRLCAEKAAVTLFLDRRCRRCVPVPLEGSLKSSSFPCSPIVDRVQSLQGRSGFRALPQGARHPPVPIPWGHDNSRVLDLDR